MYKIKFLQSQKNDLATGELVKKTLDVSMSDSDVEHFAAHWKSMGFLKIEEIKIIPQPEGVTHKDKYTPADLVQLFYKPEGIVNGKECNMDINAVDLKVKAVLEKEYGLLKDKKSAPAPADDPPVIDPAPADDPEWKKSEDAEKTFRKDKVYPALNKAGIKFAFNQNTETLLGKLKDAGIEI